MGVHLSCRDFLRAASNGDFRTHRLADETRRVTGWASSDEPAQVTPLLKWKSPGRDPRALSLELLLTGVSLAVTRARVAATGASLSRLRLVVAAPALAAAGGLGVLDALAGLGVLAAASLFASAIFAALGAGVTRRLVLATSAGSGLVSRRRRSGVLGCEGSHCQHKNDSE